MIEHWISDAWTMIDLFFAFGFGVIVGGLGVCINGERDEDER